MAAAAAAAAEQRGVGSLQEESPGGLSGSRGCVCYVSLYPVATVIACHFIKRHSYILLGQSVAFARGDGS